MERRRSGRRSIRSRTRYNKPFSEKVKNYFRSFIAFMFSNIGIVGLVIGYTIAGAFIFIEIEGEGSKQRTYDVFRTRNATAVRLWELTYKLNTFNETYWKSIVRKEMEEYQQKVVNAVKAGFDGSDTVEDSKQWSFCGAFLYSLTVITTIGYGNVSPRTDTGKLVTIAYAIMGMPLFLLYLSNIGDIMARSFKWTYARCCLCRWCPSVTRKRAERRYRRKLQHSQSLRESKASSLDHDIRHSQQIRQDLNEMEHMGYGTSRSIPSIHLEHVNNARMEDGVGNGDNQDSEEAEEEEDDEDESSDDSNDPEQVTVPLTICLAIMVGYVCGGAILFSKWEDWNFLDGSYFCFISLSTIGFGDIVPGDKIYNSSGIELSFIFCSMYLYLGMALIAMCFNLMQEEVIHKIRTVMKTIRYVLGCKKR